MHNGASVSSMMMRQNPNEFNIVMANLGAGRAAGGWGLLEGVTMGPQLDRNGDEIPEILQILKLL